MGPFSLGDDDSDTLQEEVEDSEGDDDSSSGNRPFPFMLTKRATSKVAFHVGL